MAAALLAATSSTHAQTNWIGATSSDWFTARNWSAGVPTAGTNAIINTVSPNPTVVASPGVEALNLTVGQNGTGELTIQSGGTVNTMSLGAVGNLAGSQGMVTVTGAGSTWTNSGNVVVGGIGTGTLTIQNGGTVNSGGGASVGQSVGSNWYGDGDRPGLQLEQRSRRRAQYRRFWHGNTHDRERWESHQYHWLHRQHRQ